jgi:hypothetical protein
MASDDTGDWGQPNFLALGAPEVDVDPNDVSDYFAAITARRFTTQVLLNAAGAPPADGYMARVDAIPGAVFIRISGAWVMHGTARFDDAADRDAAITSPAAGMHARLADSRLVWEYVGSSWIPLLSPERHQADTTNSVRGVLVQTGIGKITGSVAATINEAVTFPVAYSGVPVVKANMMGQKATGAYLPTGLSGTPSLFASAQLPSTTGFTAHIYQATGGNLTTANDYYYAWEARGVPA